MSTVYSPTSALGQAALGVAQLGYAEMNNGGGPPVVTPDMSTWFVNQPNPVPPKIEVVSI